MGDKLAMRRPGSQFSGDGLALSWALGGEREVKEFPRDKRTPRITQRIAQGQIVEVDDPVTETVDTEARVYRLLDGDEARAHKAKPAGPVVRYVYQRDDGTISEASVQEPHETDKYNEGVQRAAEQAEETSNLIAKQQVAGAKEIAKRKAEDAKKEKDAPSRFDIIGQQQQEAETDKIALSEERSRAAIAEQAEAHKAKAQEAAKKEKVEGRPGQTVTGRDIQTRRQ